MNEPLERIDPELEALLREDAETTPPPHARTRVLSRLAGTIPGLDPEGGGGPGDPGGTGGLTGAGSLASKLLSVLAFVALGGAGAAAWLAPLSAEEAPVELTDLVLRAPPAARSATDVEPSVVAPEREMAATAASNVAPARSRATASAHAPPQAPLPTEQALLDAARVAIGRDDPATALASLGEHARRFPRGMLEDERDALYVQALARAGRGSDARARAEALRKRSPDSLFLPAVDAALATIP